MKLEADSLKSSILGGAEESFYTALDSTKPLALIGMGAIRYQQQRCLEATEYLEKSRTGDPDTLFLLCDAYYGVGRPEQAALIAEVVRALGADRKALLDGLGKLVVTHLTNPHRWFHKLQASHG